MPDDRTPALSERQRVEGNNQLGVILAHAELLESKAPEGADRARAAHVVGATLEALRRGSGQALSVTQSLRTHLEQ